MTDHTIETLDKLPPNGSANWHQVICSCGWTRKYVSRYRAMFMAYKHTQAALKTGESK